MTLKSDEHVPFGQVLNAILGGTDTHTVSRTDPSSWRLAPALAKVASPVHVIDLISRIEAKLVHNRVDIDDVFDIIADVWTERATAVQRWLRQRFWLSDTDSNETLSVDEFQALMASCTAETVSADESNRTLSAARVTSLYRNLCEDADGGGSGLSDASGFAHWAWGHGAHPDGAEG